MKHGDCLPFLTSFGAIANMLLYSIVYRFRDLDYHEDTLSIGTDPKVLIKRAKEWAKNVNYYPSDKQEMWLYTWENGDSIDQQKIPVQWENKK